MTARLKSYPLLGFILTTGFAIATGGATVRADELRTTDPPNRAATADTTPPTITIFRAEAGKLKTSNRNVLLRGQVSDASGVKEVKIDGQSVKLRGVA